MTVLITNDDGIASPGMHALARALAAVMPVAVVAPEHERSATGHAITLHKPLRAVRLALPGLDAPVWATNGTPADCVVLGVLDLLPQRPEVVVSGINAGPNLGGDLTYSGTVSGAMEGAIMGIPSVAVSVGADDAPRFDVAAEVAVRLVQLVREHGLPADTLLNVNVPNLPRDRLRGMVATHQGRRRYINRLDKRRDPRGQTYYWLGGEREPAPDEEGTDAWALQQGMVSVTPIQMNMTATGLIAELGRLLRDISL
ncbi:MAG: 5'/3'-nucleotidase SurE [Armatimonadota bacterium]|nr:5'/3'-nucleotidase SurE [Armatimonadota bacterium]MDR7428409.1 5'/3'-nucleotidase SurE [Armatimonadota bacterium]MDR7465022.1 5'/3'-nucleotidase SurE [Armatimonadota bacterium]MDR7475948.1 5'/3'-nucleotidase SurE [Armatimonadota bacterium]